MEQKGETMRNKYLKNQESTETKPKCNAKDRRWVQKRPTRRPELSKKTESCWYT